MKKAVLASLVILLIGAVALPGQDQSIFELKEKILEIQNKGTLSFADFTLCSKIFGFGSYVPLPEPVIEANGTLLVYYEPANIFTNKRTGLYEIWYTQDMTLLQADGTEIKTWKDILNFKYAANKPVMDLFAQNSLNLEGLTPGKYKFRALVKDQLSGKTAEKTIEFEIK